METTHLFQRLSIWTQRHNAAAADDDDDDNDDDYDDGDADDTRWSFFYPLTYRHPDLVTTYERFCLAYSSSAEQHRTWPPNCDVFLSLSEDILISSGLPRWERLWIDSSVRGAWQIFKYDTMSNEDTQEHILYYIQGRLLA